MNKTALTLALSLSLIGSSALAISPPAMKWFTDGQALERADKLPEAEAAFRQAAALDPNDYLSVIKLASVLTQEGKLAEAISNYQRALSLNSQDTMTNFSLGALYEQTGKFDKAEEAYQRGLTRNPKYHFGYFNLARCQIQQNKPEAAVASFKQFLSWYSDHYEARKLLANVLLMTGKNQEAAAEYDVLKAKFPQRFSDHVNLAKALNRTNQPEEALSTLKEAATNEGAQRADILEEMGHAHSRLGDTAYALNNYQQALTLDPTRYDLSLNMADIYEKQQKPDKAIESYQNFLLKEPDKRRRASESGQPVLRNRPIRCCAIRFQPSPRKIATPQARYAIEKQIAYAYQMKGNLPEAISRYEALLQDPEAKTDTQLKINLAVAYHKQNQLEQAIALYKNAYIQLAPVAEASPDAKTRDTFNTLGNDLANALVTVGDQHFAKNEYEPALNAYGEAALYGKPDNWYPYLGLGNAYFALGMLDKAEEAYSRTLDKNPNNITARTNLAKIDLKLHPGTPTPTGVATTTPQQPSALTTLEKLAAENPLLIDSQLALGDAYYDLGRYADAATQYEKALDNPSLVKGTKQQEALYSTLGDVYQNLNQPIKAGQAFEAARAINPQNPEVHYNLGVVYGELNKLPQAEASYKEALALDESLSDSRYGLAVTLEKQQRFAEALQVYETYAQNPQARYWKEAQSRISLLQQANSAPKAPGSPLQ